MAPGTVDECDVLSARLRQNRNQTTLHSFDEEHDATYIGIVKIPDDDITEVIDVQDFSLAPHDDLFDDWKEERDEYLMRGLPSKKAHNRAFDSVNYRKRFLQWFDDQDWIPGEHPFEKYAERIRNGEHIVFVCYCGNGFQCHRRIVKEKVYEQA